LFDHGLDLRDGLDTLLRSRAFFTAPPRLSSPLLRLVSLARELELGAESAPLVAWLAGQLGHAMFDPPSVAGWPEGRDWISTGALLGRYEAAAILAGDAATRASFAAQLQRHLDALRQHFEHASGLDDASYVQGGEALQQRLTRVDAQLAVHDALAPLAVQAARHCPVDAMRLAGTGDGASRSRQLQQRLLVHFAPVVDAQLRSVLASGHHQAAAQALLLLLATPISQLH
jgi:hypothetical protein